MYSCVLLCTPVCSCVLLCTLVCSCVLSCTLVCSCVLLRALVYSRVLECLDVSSVCNKPPVRYTYIGGLIHRFFSVLLPEGPMNSPVEVDLAYIEYLDKYQVQGECTGTVSNYGLSVWTCCVLVVYSLILLCADMYICVYLCIQVTGMSLKKMGWQEFMSAPGQYCLLKWYPWLIFWAECPWCLMLPHQGFHTGMSLFIYCHLYMCACVLMCTCLQLCWHTILFERYHAQQATAFPRGVANSSLTSNDGSKLYYIHHLGLQWARSKLCFQRYAVDCCGVLHGTHTAYTCMCTHICCCAQLCAGCVLLFDTLPNTWAWTLQSGKLEQVQSSQILPVWIHTSKKTRGKMM